MRAGYNVFTYGTLMFPEVWSSVVCGDYLHRPASIAGFERFEVIGEDFPAIIPASKNCIVKGVLYLNVSKEDLERLDVYESNIYQRQLAELLEEKSALGAEPEQADVYVLNPDYLHLLGKEPWDENKFFAKLKKRFY